MKLGKTQCSDVDSDNEPLSSSSESDLDNEDALNNFQISRDHRQTDFRCKLQRHLFKSKEVYPHACALLDAHIQLDGEANGDTIDWRIVRAALVSYVDSSLVCQGDIKTFIKFNAGSSIISCYLQIWTASVIRLRQRITTLLNDLAKNGRIRQYGTTLSNTDRKAFSAIVQIWRKSLRGNTIESGLQYHSLLTSVQVSLLLRQNDAAILFLCGRDFIHASCEALDAAQLLIEEASWHFLYICADEGQEAKILLHHALCWYDRFSSINVGTHEGSEGMQQNKAAGLSPLLLKNQSITHVHNEVREGDVSDIFRSNDYRHVIKMLMRSSGIEKAFNRPPRLASLSLLSCAVIRDNLLDPSLLPRHLQRSVETVAHCTSCERFMARQTADDDDREAKARFTLQASNAGFKVQRPIIQEVLDSLRHGDCYLPPLCESVRLVDREGKRSVSVDIGGATVASTMIKRREEFDWQFCARCAALHSGVIASSQTDCCKCIVCTRDREALKDCKATFSPWRRIHGPLKQGLQEQIADKQDANVH